MSQIKKNALIVFKGFCMGVADIIPGVSGGTVAFLVGIYEELIESISSFDMRFVRDLLGGRVLLAFSRTGWKFLAMLLTGILSAIFSLSHLLKWLMANKPVYVNAFFFGLILTTVFVIVRKIKRLDLVKSAAGITGAFLMFLLVGMMPVQTPETWWFLFLSGAIAICAMILPGISGAFIMLLLGKYEYLITAVSEFNFGALIIVASGCVAGLAAFVRILRWLLHRHHDLTLSILAGLVLGSLRKVWPWKEQVNFLPKAITAETALAALFFSLGICLSLWLAMFDQKREV